MILPADGCQQLGCKLGIRCTRALGSVFENSSTKPAWAAGRSDCSRSQEQDTKYTSLKERPRTGLCQVSRCSRQSAISSGCLSRAAYRRQGWSRYSDYQRAKRIPRGSPTAARLCSHGYDDVSWFADCLPWRFMADTGPVIHRQAANYNEESSVYTNVVLLPGNNIHTSEVVCSAGKISTLSRRLSPPPGSADLPLTTSARLVVVEENSNHLQHTTRPRYKQPWPMTLDNYEEIKHAYLNN